MVQLTSATQALTPRQRRQLAGVLLAWVAFIAYGSWVPLNFQPRDPVSIWVALWQWTPDAAMQAQRLDTAVNVLLMMPLGFGLALLWLRPGMGVVAHVVRLGIVLLVLPLSLLVEWGQGFLPGRNASLGDVLAQTTGTVLGLGLYGAFGPRARQRLAAVGAALDARSRAVQALHLYLLGLLLFALMPLDLTLDLGELYRKWREGRVVLMPFGALRAPVSEALYEVFTDVLLWVPVGALWAMDATRRPVWVVVVRAVLLATAIEGAQLLVLSRVSDATDVVMSAAGACLGAVGVPRLAAALAGDRRQLRLAFGLGFWLWLAAAVWIYGWPFAARWPAHGWAAFADAFWRVPFITYFQRNEFGALNEILRKLLVFAPGGILLRLWRPESGRSLPLLLVLAVMLEAGQVLLADRVADLTDAGLAMLGAALGWRLAGWLQGIGLPAGSAGPAGVAARSYAASLAASTGPRHRVWQRQVVGVVAVALALWLLARLPGVPYNVAKLMPSGPAGMMSAVGVALAAWWIAALPVAFVRAPRPLAMALPAALLLHGLASFAVLRLAVPLPMLHKVIGSPVLGWPGLLEDLLRYLALHVSLMLPLCGAAALVAVLRQPAALNRLIYWALLVAALAWPLHWAVVEQAATDNLVELMRDGGGFGASTGLALAILALGACASALACLSSTPRRRGVLVVLMLVSAVATPAALLAGLEPVVFKYDRVFSALQFILSAGRDAYATGLELAWRYAAAHAGVAIVLAWLQTPWWRHEWLARPTTRRTSDRPFQ